jgi:peptide/nickel transport system permease protein
MLIFAIPIGVYSAIKPYSVFDNIITTFSFAGQSVPVYWLGLILIVIFYLNVQSPFGTGPLFPAGGMYTVGREGSLPDLLWHLVLPITAMSFSWIAWYSRFLRSSMLEVVHQDYIRTARAKGLNNWKVLYKHALRNALVPLVTLLALDLPYIFGGAIFVEFLFAWPGMGRLYYQAALNRDYPILMAVLIIGASFIILSNLLADILYAWLDPRIRLE